MKQIVRKIFALMVLISVGLLLVSCNMPESEEENDAAAQQTSVAQTVEASLLTMETPQEPTVTETTSAIPSLTAGTTSLSQTPTGTLAADEVVGDDRAEFIADVTIQDYSEQQLGDEITKTWRIRNTGDTTWSTDYYLDFEKGDKLGAPDTIKLTKEVGPNAYIDLSVDFTVPETAGEYTSYWRLRNADGELVGIDEEGTPLSLYMVIQAVGEGEGTDDGSSSGGSSSGGISGGAKVSGASVSVDDASYSGSCPGQVTFTYTVTTANAGKVNFYLDLTAISPAAYTFDDTPEYSINFTGGYTVTYTYTLFSNSSVSATAKVVAVGEDTYTSAPINFSVNCN